MDRFCAVAIVQGTVTNAADAFPNIYGKNIIPKRKPGRGVPPSAVIHVNTAEVEIIIRNTAATGEAERAGILIKFPDNRIASIACNCAGTDD